MKLKREKCVFVQPSIKYLRHILTGDGFRPDHNKVESVVKSSPPANQEQLESFNELVQYYNRHVPNLSLVACSLNKLRKRKVRFEWTLKHQFWPTPKSEGIIGPPCSHFVQRNIRTLPRSVRLRI